MAIQQLRYFLCVLTIAMLFGTISSLAAQQPSVAPPSKADIYLEKLNKEATALAQGGKLLPAAQRWQSALKQAQALQKPLYTAKFLRNLGIMNDHLGQYSKAKDYCIRALEFNRKQNDTVNIAASYNSLGIACYHLGQADGAITNLTKALDIYRQKSDPASIADACFNLGIMCQNFGRYDKALDYQTQALDIYKQSMDPANIAIGSSHLGAIYDRLGRYEEALNYCTQSIDQIKEMKSPGDAASVLINLAMVYDDLGEYEQALNCYTQSLAFVKQTDSPAYIATLLNDRGGTYGKLNQPAKALEDFTQAWEIRKHLHSPSQIASSLNNIGIAYENAGQYDKALDYHTRALNAYRKVGNPADIAISLNNIGGIYHHLHRLPEAETTFIRSRILIERLSREVNDPSQVGALQDTLSHFYERYASLRLEQHKPAEALQLLETGRGQGLQRLLLVNLAGGLSRFLTPTEQQTFRKASDELTAANRQLQAIRQQLAISPPDQQASLNGLVKQNQQTANEAERMYLAVYEQMFRAHPKLNQLAGKKTATMPELRQFARDHANTLYLEYGIVDANHTLLFALGDKDGLKSFKLPTGDKQWKLLTQQWRQALEHSGGRGVQNVNPDQRALAALNEQKTAKQAYTFLLGAVEKAGLLQAGRYKRLVVVGSGAILEMPLCALCDASGTRLVARYPISQALSLSVFFWRANPSVPSASLLCIADPTGIEPNPVEASVPASAPASVVTQNESAPVQTVPTRGVFRSEFAPLPGARAEGHNVASLFPGSILLVGPQAHEKAVLPLLLRFAILHFATHGFLVPHQPLASGLVLADPATPQEDGLLTAQKIMNLTLSAKLAVLSACDTGRGVVQGGEGLLGLAWAFRGAGCPALLASQWPVDDVATRELMERFYRELQAARPKDEALQTAMLDVQCRHASPSFWAAFTLIGDMAFLPQ